MHLRLIGAAIAVFAFGLSVFAQDSVLSEVTAIPAPPAMEVYGELPAIRFVRLSPDGKHLAWVQAIPEGEYLAVSNLETGQLVAGSRLANFFPTSITFATEKHVVISGSQVIDRNVYADEWDFTSALALNLDTGKTAQLLRSRDDLVAQSGLGDILGPGEKSNEVLMAGFQTPSRVSGAVSAYRDARLSLFSVNLDNGRGRLVKRGIPNTTRWTTGDNGEPIAFITYDNSSDDFAMHVRANRKWVKVFEDKDAERPRFSVAGMMPGGSDYVLITRSEGTNGIGVYSMGLDGEQKGPHFYRDGREIAQLLFSRDNQLVGIEYTGLKPDYHLFDEAYDGVINEIGDAFPDAAVRLVSWSDDWERLVFSIDGPGNPGAFYLFNAADSSLQFLSDPRPTLPNDMISKVDVMPYTAADGLELNALLTWPIGKEKATNLPTVMLPHGGPGSYDRIGFDWLAQFFASRGYLVVQPNFRGSTGFGQALYDAGKGEWGKKMQSDLSDALATLTEAGHVNPDRVCIVGVSYGGYAALAGGAFTPEFYKCVVAIAPVSDIPVMMNDVEDDSGRSHWVVDYWAELTVNRGDQDSMEEVSPSRHAENFQAPVLLIHGRDDTVVELEQSRIMERALKRADKSVEFIVQYNGDHWLTARETRLETLQAAGTFVDQHIGQ